jgi:hypothetical protein
MKSRLVIAVPLAALGILLFVSAPPRAQPAGNGPIACFVDVTRAGLLDQASAKQLCLGSNGTGAAQCFLEAWRIGLLTQTQMVQLCSQATSDEPVQCARRLASSGLTSAGVVQYCAASSWPLVVPPGPGTADCLDSVRRQRFSDYQAAQVCRGAGTSEPAECVAHGHQQTGLADGDLIDLCTTRVPWPVASNAY